MMAASRLPDRSAIQVIFGRRALHAELQAYSSKPSPEGISDFVDPATRSVLQAAWDGNMEVFERALGELWMSEKEKDDEMAPRLIVEAAACVAALLGNRGILTLLLESSTSRPEYKDTLFHPESNHLLLRAAQRDAWTSIWTLLDHDFLSASSNPRNLIGVVNSLVLNPDHSPRAPDIVALFIELVMVEWAATNGESHMLSVLLPHCPKSALSHRNLLHETLLSAPVANLRVLLESAKVDVNALSERIEDSPRRWKSTRAPTLTDAVFAAGREGQELEKVRLLLEFGADLEVRDEEGWTAGERVRGRGLKKGEKVLNEWGGRNGGSVGDSDGKTGGQF